MVLSTGDLARMRRDLESLLPDTCTIQTATTATSDYGAPTRTWADTYTAVECRAARIGAQVRAQMRAYGEQPTAVADWVVTLHHDQVIAMGNRIVLASLTLEIVDISDDESWKAGQRVLCREVRTG